MKNENEMSPDAKKELSVVKHWVTELESARRRSKEYFARGRKVVDIYECKSKEAVPFNILMANTETLAPTLYNNTPRPAVFSRHHTSDPLAKAGGLALQRVLSFLLDDNQAEYPSFDRLMEKCVMSGLVPGRGILRWKYDAEISKQEAPETGEPVEAVSYEEICGKIVPWNWFFFGYATVWEEVPWVAFGHPMTKEEVRKNFGDAVAQEVKYCDDPEAGEGEEGKARGENEGRPEVAWFYEFWDKASKTQFFLNSSLDYRLKVAKDPYKLTGFFPMPEPLQFIERVNSLDPLPLYDVYSEQAEELQAITVRLKHLIKAMKIRGAYNGAVEGIEKVLEAEENTLVPVENMASLGENQQMDKTVWLLPIERYMPTIQQLYAQREQVKGIIYELSGIADVMRGNTQASETLGAQELKTQWGAIRIRRAQKEVARFARDCMRIMAELAVTFFSEDTFAAMTGLPFPRAMEKKQLQAAMGQYQTMGQPAPPEMQAQMQVPSWEEVLDFLRNGTQRTFRIDIETNSTLETDATEDKQDLSELLNAVAQFFNGVGPLVQAGVFPMESAKELLLSVVRRFRLGPEVEDALSAIGQQQQPQGQGQEGPSPEQQAAEQKAQAEAAVAQQEMQLKQQEMALRAQELQMEAELKQREHALKLEELAMKQQLTNAKYRAQIAAAQAKAATAVVTQPTQSSGGENAGV